MSMQWYAVHTFTGQENNIKKRLEQMIEREGVQDKFGRIIVPTREVVSNVRGKRRVSVQNLFPAYIIIEMELDELTQHLVSTINGVTHLARSKFRIQLAKMSASRKVRSRALWAS